MSFPVNRPPLEKLLDGPKTCSCSALLLLQYNFTLSFDILQCILHIDKVLFVAFIDQACSSLLGLIDIIHARWKGAR